MELSNKSEEEVLKGDDIPTVTNNISLIQKCVAELIGTAFLVFIVTGIPVFSIREDDYYENVVSYNGCFEAAFVLASMIYVFGRISGAHFNPAVTIPMFLRKKITLIECAFYISAQIVGAFIGSIFVGLCNRGNFDNLAGNTIESVDGDDINGWDIFSCFFIEVILTFGLVFVIFASTIKANNFGNLTGLVVGISLYFLGIAGSHVSGGSLNPARSIAPAIIMAFKGKKRPLEHLVLYIIAPIIGGIAAGYLNILFE